MKKTIFNIIIKSIAAIVLFALVMLTSCTPGYKEYRTDKNKLSTVTVGIHKLTAYFFLLESGDAVMDICNDAGRVYQSLEFPKDGNDYYTSLDFEFAYDNAIFQDMNFDGELDLYVPCSVTTPNLEGMAWLWDSEAEEFVLSEELSALYELTVFPEDKLITSQDYTAPDGILCKEFVWKDGALVQTGEYTITN